MPTLNLFTNLPVDAVIASDILKDATKAVAKIIGKPESVELFELFSVFNHIYIDCYLFDNIPLRKVFINHLVVIVSIFTSNFLRLVMNLV